MALQESCELSAPWHQRPSREAFCTERYKQAEAEWAAWQAWFEGHFPPSAQVLAAWDTVQNNSNPPRPGAEGARSPGRGGSVDAQSTVRGLPAHGSEGEAAQRSKAQKQHSALRRAEIDGPFLQLWLPVPSHVPLSRLGSGLEAALSSQSTAFIPLGLDREEIRKAIP